MQETGPEAFFLRFQSLCLWYWCWADGGQVEVGLAAVCCTMWREDLLWLYLSQSLPPPEGGPLQQQPATTAHTLTGTYSVCTVYSRLHQLYSAWNMEARGFWYRISDRFYHLCHDMIWALSYGDESLVVGITRAVWLMWGDVTETLARCWWWLWSVLFWCSGVAGGGRAALCSPRCVPGQPAPPRRHLSAVGGTTTRLCTTAQQSEAILTSRYTSIFTRFEEGTY